MVWKGGTLAWVAWAFITGGAIGNIIDRIFLGAVLDFLDFHYQDMHFPIFNLADAAIVLGAFLLLIVQEDHKQTKQHLP